MSDQVDNVARRAARMLPKRTVQWIKHSPVFVRKYSSLVNIMHCCVQKTGSSWLTKILRDSNTFKYCGLDVAWPQYPSNYENLWQSHPGLGISPKTIVSPLYISYAGYKNVAKVSNCKSFFIMRDPRDIVVSWYFSAKKSHPVGNNSVLREIRAKLNSLSREDGLLFSVDYLEKYGLFFALRDWVFNSSADSRVLIKKFEDLTGPNQTTHMRLLFEHCEIPMPQGRLESLLEKWSFKKLQDISSKQGVGGQHYRSGKFGDWKNHFNDRHKEYFHEVTGDLCTILTYEDSV